MAIRRCPECGTVNRPTVPACECGFVFDQAQAEALGISGAGDLQHETPEDQRHYHMHRLTIGWFMVVGAVLALAASTLLVLFRFRLLILAIAGSIGLLLKGSRQIGVSRRALRALDDAHAKLPKAKLVSR